MNILNKIIYLIKKNGFAETEFALLAGLNRGVVSDWRSGKTKSYNKHLPKIAEVLGVDVDYLLDNTERAERNEQPLSEDMQKLIDESMDLSLDEINKVLEYVDFLRARRNQ